MAILWVDVNILTNNQNQGGEIMRLDKAIDELRDKLTGLDREIKVRASDIQHYFWLYLEDDNNGTLMNQCRRNDAGYIEVRTVNRVMHTSTEKERTPEEFDTWRETLERM